MDERREEINPDRAGVSPEIQTAELAHAWQSGKIERYLAEACDALATAGVRGLEAKPVPDAIPEAARAYRAFKLGLPPELQTLDGFYLIMDDIAIELAHLARDARPPVGRIKRAFWVLECTFQIYRALRRFLLDCYPRKKRRSYVKRRKA